MPRQAKSSLPTAVEVEGGAGAFGGDHGGAQRGERGAVAAEMGAVGGEGQAHEDLVGET